MYQAARTKLKERLETPTIIEICKTFAGSSPISSFIGLAEYWLYKLTQSTDVIILVKKQATPIPNTDKNTENRESFFRKFG